MSRVVQIRCRTPLTDGWDGRHNFTQFELVENSRLSRGIETDHENTCNVK